MAPHAQDILNMNYLSVIQINININWKEKMTSPRAPENNVFYRSQNWSYPKITHGSGIYLYDESGKEYIDACSGSSVANIGHGNKEIAEYARQQIEKIAFTHLSRWTAEPIEECAAKVANWTPGDLNHVYFVSGGSEATETAMKMARQYYVERDGSCSGKWKVISKWNSFHGNTLGAMSMSGISSRRNIYDPMLAEFPKIPQFYFYRNPWNCSTSEECSIKAAEALEEEILRQGAQNIAAFISEVVVGSACPGINPEPVYFKMVRDICDKYDILLIIDEVMSGFGRTGRNFAVEHYEILPDIMAMAKGMSCGYTPIGAAVANDEVFDTIMRKGSGSFIHGHTYAGNPLSCGIAAKVVNIIEREKYVDNASKQGEYLLEKMQKLYSNPIVGDIRGKGLMIGVELVKDHQSKEPFAPKSKIANKLMLNCFEQGLIVYPGGGAVDGEKGDHVLLTPPISINRREVDVLYNKLEIALNKTAEEAGMES